MQERTGTADACGAGEGVVVFNGERAAARLGQSRGACVVADGEAARAFNDIRAGAGNGHGTGQHVRSEIYGVVAIVAIVKRDGRPLSESRGRTAVVPVLAYAAVTVVPRQAVAGR